MMVDYDRLFGRLIFLFIVALVIVAVVGLIKFTDSDKPSIREMTKACEECGFEKRTDLKHYSYNYLTMIECDKENIIGIDWMDIEYDKWGDSELIEKHTTLCDKNSYYK